MNSGTPEETERNRMIYQDFVIGMSYVDMVAKYRLSSQRLWQIIKREKKREDKKLGEGFGNQKDYDESNNK